MASGTFCRGPFAYLHWRLAVHPFGGESHTPMDPWAGRLTLRVLVDRTSV